MDQCPDEEQGNSGQLVPIWASHHWVSAGHQANDRIAWRLIVDRQGPLVRKALVEVTCISIIIDQSPHSRS